MPSAVLDAQHATVLVPHRQWLPKRPPLADNQHSTGQKSLSWHADSVPSKSAVPPNFSDRSCSRDSKEAVESQWLLIRTSGRTEESPTFCQLPTVTQNQISLWLLIDFQRLLKEPCWPELLMLTPRKRVFDSCQSPQLIRITLWFRSWMGQFWFLSLLYSPKVRFFKSPTSPYHSGSLSPIPLFQVLRGFLACRRPSTSVSRRWVHRLRNYHPRADACYRYAYQMAHLLSVTDSRIHPRASERGQRHVRLDFVSECYSGSVYRLIITICQSLLETLFLQISKRAPTVIFLKNSIPVCYERSFSPILNFLISSLSITCQSNHSSGANTDFDKLSNLGLSYYGEHYDYTSIMHYEANEGSRNGKNTIEAKVHHPS